MYEFLRHPEGRPWAKVSDWLAAPPQPHAQPQAGGQGQQRLILRMRENRSHLGNDARAAFSVIAVVLVATTILPALKGYWLVPVFSLAALAALTFALDRHAKSRPASETLELIDGRVRYRDSAGRVIEYPAFRMRLAAEGRGPSDLRLFLRSRDGAIEFGRCLSLDERREVAPLVAAALAETRGRQPWAC